MKIDNYPIYFRMSERKDGSMKKEENVKKFLNRINIPFLTRAGLCHGKDIYNVKLKDKGKIIKNVDGLRTKEKNLFISITVADCIPVAFYDYKEEEIGLIHAGWKGIYSGIIEEIGSKNKVFYIGPGISSCHFEVSKEFPLPYFLREGKYYSDLKGIIKEKLLSGGALLSNIEVSEDCTYCMEKKYSSFRREGEVKPMLVILGIKL